MTDLSTETLLNIGFRDIGKWVARKDATNIRYELDGTNATANEAMLDVRSALYAFVQGEKVNYIGKTARSIRKRFTGYCNPGPTQQTNQRCHDNIKLSLKKSVETRIFVFTPIPDLRYGEFQIDLAAGLEESLILAFTPPWNGREGKRLLTEEAEREKTEESRQEGGTVNSTDAQPIIGASPLKSASVTARTTRPVSFQIKLGAAYYQQGIINPGTDASQYLGAHGNPVIIYLGSDSDQVDSTINRTANSNGSVRIIGNNRFIAEWFQENFEPGDIVEAKIQDPQHILLIAPSSIIGTARSAPSS